MQRPNNALHIYQISKKYFWKIQNIYSTIEWNYCVLGANVLISKITCKLRGQRRNGWRPALALVYVPQAYSLRRLMQTAPGDMCSNANLSSAHLSMDWPIRFSQFFKQPPLLTGKPPQKLPSNQDPNEALLNHNTLVRIFMETIEK